MLAAPKVVRCAPPTTSTAPEVVLKPTLKVETLLVVVLPERCRTGRSLVVRPVTFNAVGAAPLLKTPPLILRLPPLRLRLPRRVRPLARLTVPPELIVRVPVGAPVGSANVNGPLKLTVPPSCTSSDAVPLLVAPIFIKAALNVAPAPLTVMADV